MHTLLLADGSVTTQRLVALTFADELFRVVTVSDGQQALDAMAAMRPDIVLAGTTLPHTDGYDLSARMRGIDALRQVPVLLLSGAFESVDAGRLTESGARGVIEKPLEPTVVISRVRELLGLKDARPAAPAGRLVTTADTAADKKAEPPPLTATAGRKPAVSARDEFGMESGLEPEASSVEGATPGSGRDHSLNTLAAGFGSLDQHLAGGHQDAPAPAEGLGFDFDFDLVEARVAPPEVLDGAAPIVPEVQAVPEVHAASAPVVLPDAPLPAGTVADDFAALLAFETGDGPAPAPVGPVAPVVVQAPAPQITEAMLDQIAERVVERLNAANFGANLQAALTATVRDTVRGLVSETSERLVRDEIERVKGRIERDTR